MKKIKFDNAIKRLEEIVKALEDDVLSIEDSLRLFEEGVKLSRLCNRILDNAERSVQILVNKGDRSEAEPFIHKCSDIEVSGED